MGRKMKKEYWYLLVACCSLFFGVSYAIEKKYDAEILRKDMEEFGKIMEAIRESNSNVFSELLGEDQEAADFNAVVADAEAGYPISQFLVGTAYEMGDSDYGFSKSYEKAAEWYRKAAEQGLADGQFYLGFAYMHGQGVEQDYSKSFEWFNKAAMQNHKRAFSSLGFLYENALGTKQSNVQAFLSYALAEDNEQLVRLQKYMTDEEIEAGRVLWLAWKEKKDAA